MTIIVEDGSIVSNANSYVTIAELEAYATARGVTITSAELQLTKSMDYIERLSFIGVKSTQDQSLQWPRYNVIIDGYYLDSNVIPNELKNAQIETAMSIFAGTDPLADIPRQKKSATVGAVSVEYQGTQSTTIVRKINTALSKLLVSNNGISFPVMRG